MSEPSSNSAPDSPLPPVTRNRWLRWARIAFVSYVLFLVIRTTLILGFMWHPVMEAREASHRSQCQSNLKQLGQALRNYHDVYGSFPPAFVPGPDGRPWHSWRVLILPYLDYN